MPPHLELSAQYAKVTIGLKRKIEDEQPGVAKKRAEELDVLPSCFSKSEYPIEFSPPREEDTTVPPGLSEDQNLHQETVDPTSATSEVTCSSTTATTPSQYMSQDDASQSSMSVEQAAMLTTTSSTTSFVPAMPPVTAAAVEDASQISPLRGDVSAPGDHEDSDSDLQQVPVKRCADEEAEQRLKRQCTVLDPSIPKESRPPSSLEEPLIMPPESTEENKENLVCLKTLTESQNFESILQKTLLATRTDGSGVNVPGGRKCDNSLVASSNAKVIVEHLPSSVYELDHNTALDEATSLDDEEDEDSDDESSMFDTPPPKTAYDRFWSTSTTLSNNMTSTVTQPTTTTSTNSTAAAPLVSTYQFLEQNNQRIECDENGKSYLQLGTVNHHHLPVTPVLQPKPTTLTPRRGPGLSTGLCRPSALPPRPPNPTPPVVCEHPPQSTTMLTARSCSASCYRQQRSDMLSLSLHKLHTARQRSDSSLRRSVLICNMLRYIELESTTEQRQQAESIGYGVQEPIVGGLDQSPYWNTSPVPNFSPPPTPNPYRDNGGAGGGYSGGMTSNPTPGASPQSSCENFDAPLKDFNSAFRQSSSVSLVTNSSCSGGGDMSPTSLAVVTSPSHSSSSSVPSSPTSLDDERGINWSSVLSLTSQTELDPLNNNSYSDSSVGGCWATGASLSEQLDLSQTSFEDVSWKVAAALPAATDELMKSFPEENLFECAA